MWPLIAPGTFQAVTGPKEDLWLARTVGLLLAAAGAALALAGRRRRVTPELALIGAGFAAALSVVDVFCVFEPRTTAAYWLDAPVELALLIAWCRWWPRRIEHDAPRI